MSPCQGEDRGFDSLHPLTKGDLIQGRGFRKASFDSDLVEDFERLHNSRIGDSIKYIFSLAAGGDQTHIPEIRQMLGSVGFSGSQNLRKFIHSHFVFGNRIKYLESFGISHDFIKFGVFTVYFF
jgi:hypothetical protein